MKRIISILLVVSSYSSMAQVRLPKLVSDGMVLQRDTKVNIWGWAASKEKVSVKFHGKNYKTQAGKDGKWLVQLAPMKAGGPYKMEIAGSNKIVLNDILIGDVWFCSGQSNMVHQMELHRILYAKDIAEANYPQIRQFWIPTLSDLTGPKDDLPAQSWKLADPVNVRQFSAVAYFFAKKIYDKYKIPIGIINSSVGGTPIEAWTSEEGLRDFSNMVTTIIQNKDTAKFNSANRSAMASNAAPPSTDAGMKEKWFDPNYKPAGWRTIHIPGYWEDQGIKDLNGVVWYRREIDIPSSMTGKAATIFLGRIVDADVLYINGKQIGNTTYQYPQRRYAVPADLLKPGKNLFTVKVTNNFGKGGFVPDKPYVLFAGTDTIDLKGYWEYKVGEVYIPRRTAPVLSGQNQPTALYNAMVAPLVNYNIKGFLWYQGESNASRASEYEKLQVALIADWRNKWNLPNAPFYYVQLPGFMDYNYLPSESSWATLREAQLNALRVPNTGMAVAIDLGEWNDIHPDNKKDVGERLALLALKHTYGENIVSSGPLYQSNVIRDNKIIISFTNTGSGLVTNDGEEPGDFAIAGDDKKFVWAKTIIEGDKVIVWNENIPNPKYVRYAWADNPVHPNLYNKEGLPASPFRTDK